MTVKELVRKLSNLKEELQDKEIVIIAENGMLLPPVTHFILNDKYDAFNISGENVEKIVLTWH